MKEFVALAEIGNFTEASSRLFIAQPTLSKHIKSMEAELGGPLFIRNKRNMELSEMGHTFLPYAKQIVQIQGEYATALSAQKQDIEGTLHIGCLPSFSMYGIDWVISDFVGQHNRVSIQVEEYGKGYLLDLVHQKRCDFAFVRDGRTNYADLMKIQIATDKVVAVLPENHKLAGRDQIRLEELKYDRFLSREKGTCGHKMILKMCGSVGYEPYIVCTSNNNRNLIEMVKRGVGVTLMNRGPAMVGSRKGYVIVDLVPEFASEVSLYYNTAVDMSPTAKCFLEHVKANRERMFEKWSSSM